MCKDAKEQVEELLRETKIKGNIEKIFTIDYLLQNKGDIPTNKGVYFILNLNDKTDNLKIRDDNNCEYFNKIYGEKNNEEYTHDKLVKHYNIVKQGKYNRVLYIGKADGKNGLKQRLNPYIKQSKTHCGGRVIWKLEKDETKKLGVAWVLLDDNIDNFEKSKKINRRNK